MIRRDDDSISTSTSTGSPNTMSSNTINQQTQSPLMRSLLRFMHSPSSHSNAGISYSQPVNSSSTPTSPPLTSLPLTRAYSNPVGASFPSLPHAAFNTHSRSITPELSQLSDDAFHPHSSTSSSYTSSSNDSSLSTSPIHQSRVVPTPTRRFSISSGMPIDKALERRSSNGFLELLCKQDAFMNNGD